MHSQGKSLGRLAGEIDGFGKPVDNRDQNHRHYLQEASQFLRCVEDPLDVLRFLDSLLVSPFAKRSEQKSALGDICRWLANRLVREPYLPKDLLAYELAWLQRLAVIRTAKAPDPVSQQTSSSQSPRKPQIRFDQEIERIEKRREKLTATVVKDPKILPSKPEPRVAPKSLPIKFEAVFADIKAARFAKHTAAKRVKQGKIEKVSWLALKPVDDLLKDLAKGLSCTLDTKGCDAVFAHMAANAGQSRSFWVTEISTEDDRQVVKCITLE